MTNKYSLTHAELTKLGTLFINEQVRHFKKRP